MACPRYGVIPKMTSVGTEKNEARLMIKLHTVLFDKINVDDQIYFF